MLTKKSDYKFTDVTNVNITGHILPYREMLGEGNARSIRVEDVAFLNEAICQRSGSVTAFTAPQIITKEDLMVYVRSLNYIKENGAGENFGLKVEGKYIAKTFDKSYGFKTGDLPSQQSSIISALGGVMPQLKVENYVATENLSVDTIRRCYSDIGEFKYAMFHIGNSKFFVTGKKVITNNGVITSTENISRIDYALSGTQINYTKADTENETPASYDTTDRAITSAVFANACTNVSSVWGFIKYEFYEGHTHKYGSLWKLIPFELTKHEVDDWIDLKINQTYLGRDSLIEAAQYAGFDIPENPPTTTGWIDISTYIAEDIIVEASDTYFSAEVASLGWKY